MNSKGKLLKDSEKTKSTAPTEEGEIKDNDRNDGKKEDTTKRHKINIEEEKKGSDPIANVKDTWSFKNYRKAKTNNKDMMNKKYSKDQQFNKEKGDKKTTIIKNRQKDFEEFTKDEEQNEEKELETVEMPLLKITGFNENLNKKFTDQLSQLFLKFSKTFKANPKMDTIS